MKNVVDRSLMAGAPAPEDKRVTLANWLEPPFNRWSFSHLREIIPTAKIGRGDGPASEFERDEHDLNDVAFRFRGRTVSVAEMLEETYTDAYLVVQRGRIVSEWYVDGMTQATTHLLMSVSKSLTSALVGVMVNDGLIDPAAEVPTYVEELRGGAFEGCTIQHLLDMTAGLQWSEDYEDPECDAWLYCEPAGWLPRTHAMLPDNLYDYMAGLKENARPHGGPFEYRSVLVDVMGWVLERAGGASFSELFSRNIWSKLGAEGDADMTVDSAGCSLPDGGICTTLRDVARFGQMYLKDGHFNGQQIVPAEWTRRPWTPDRVLIEAYEATPGSAHDPGAMYHDYWWCLDPERGVFAGLGINGQLLLVHRPSETVIAKFSTQPQSYDMELDQLQIRGSLAICDTLGEG